MPSTITPRIMSSELSLTAILHLLQLSDSALPTGAFSFSNTLESAAEWGVVRDEASLESYTSQIVRTAALTDGIAALEAWRAASEGDYSRLAAADQMLYISKLNEEARQMSQRMGRKLAELCSELLRQKLLTDWCDDIVKKRVAGTYAATQGLIAALCGIDRKGLFCSLCYGTANIVLGAALRCTRTTHITTQGILFRLGTLVEMLYAEASEMEIGEMNSFAMQCDIMAALHEKGSKRLFMN